MTDNKIEKFARLQIAQKDVNSKNQLQYNQNYFTFSNCKKIKNEKGNENGVELMWW